MTDLVSGIVVAAPEPGSGEDDLRTSAEAFRQALGGLLEQTAPGEAKRGILRRDPDDGVPTGSDDGMEYLVPAAVYVVGRTDHGAFILAQPDDATITTDAADATNDRIDRVYVIQPDPEQSDTGVARVDVAIGTASSSPALPSIPTGALELGRCTVAAGITDTSEVEFTNLADLVGFAGDPIVSTSDPGVDNVPEGTRWIKPIVS